MKNLFGINNKGNNFSKFIVRSASTTSNEKMDELANKGTMIQKKELGPGWLNIVSTICVGIGLMFILGIFGAKDGFKEALKTRGYLFYIGIALFVLGLTHIIYKKVKSKKGEKSESVKNFLNEQELLKKDILNELRIPEDATVIDILLTKVKENKDGKEIAKTMGLFTHINSEVYLFLECNKVYFADYSAVIEIPLESFKSIDKINKSIVIPEWHKKVAFNNEKYKEYKVKQNSYGMVFVKPYYSIKLLIDSEDYEILIPNYDLKEFLKVVPLNVNE